MNTNECSPVCVGPESVRAEESAAPDPETHIFDGSGRWLCRRGRLDESRSLKKKCTICVERWQARRAAPRAPSVDDAMDALTVVDAGPLRLDPAKVRELLHAIGPEALAAGMRGIGGGR